MATQTSLMVGVDRTPFDINVLIQSKDPLGKFAISQTNAIAAKVKQFDLLKDTIFKSYVGAKELISAEEKLRRIIAAGDIPLDVFCLQALLQIPDIMYLLSHAFWDMQGLGGPRLESIDFLGTLVEDNGQRQHMFEIAFPYSTAATHHKAQHVAPVEVYDEGWSSGTPSIVFTKEFIKPFLN